jgi:uncharacterized protein YggL (DUF469 family)
MAKHRNRRQLKKLRVGEFRKLGFSVSAELQAPLNSQQRDALIDVFLAECIEANGMLFGGGINETLDGYVVAGQDRSSVTDRHREIVKGWVGWPAQDLGAKFRE